MSMHPLSGSNMMSLACLHLVRICLDRLWRVLSATELDSKVRTGVPYLTSPPVVYFKFVGILFTPISQSGHISWNVAMRQQLDIYAAVVLCKSLPGFPTRHSNVDFAIIRENTEGEYS